ncbi:hypothetical protein CR513_09950, partial [Mucuna pruriens]
MQILTYHKPKPENHESSPSRNRGALEMFWEKEVSWQQQKEEITASWVIPHADEAYSPLFLSSPRDLNEQEKEGERSGGSRRQVSTLTRNEDFTAGAQQALLKKCRDPGIFSVLCTIGDCTFVDAMLDLGASINVMPTSIYKSLNIGDLEPTGMTI